VHQDLEFELSNRLHRVMPLGLSHPFSSCLAPPKLVCVSGFSSTALVYFQLSGSATVDRSKFVSYRRAFVVRIVIFRSFREIAKSGLECP
jgi:hypothetical protein